MEDPNPGQSDLEDFDLAESDASECEPNPVLPMSAHAISQDCPDYRPREPLPHASTPDTRYAGFDQTCLESTPEDSHYPEREETKPKIWSLAQTATSLSQADYTACMHRGHGVRSSSTDSRLDLADSPFASLRNWVDGMFHDPLLRQSDINQSFSNSSGLWMLENRFHELTEYVPSPQLTWSTAKWIVFIMLLETTRYFIYFIKRYAFKLHCSTEAPMPMLMLSRSTNAQLGDLHFNIKLVLEEIVTFSL